jgi:fibronectin type 3 domain-containing protein
MKGSAGKRILAAVLFFVLAGAAAFSQARQPPAYVLSGGDKVIIVLGNVPSTLSGFTVFRKGPGDSAFSSLTDSPVRAVDDPSVAQQMMGSDFEWISRRVETVDPDAAWRRIRARPELGVVLSFVSNGLRMALGRTYFDLAVTPGQTYTYRIVLLDSVGAEAGRIEKQVTVGAPRAPGAATKVTAVTGQSDVTVRWDYPRFQGGDSDLAVGFNVLRTQAGQTPLLLTPSPVLRIEGMLQYVDREPVVDAPVTYSVQTVDLIGTLSPVASAAPVTFKDMTPPMAPQGVTAVDGKDGVLLVWKISPEAKADHYVVYKSGKEDSGYQPVSKDAIPVSQPRFLDANPVRGVAWYYKVTVVGKNGVASAMSGAAPIIPQKTTPPGAVQGLAFTVDAKKRTVSFHWNAVKEPDVKGYLIFRGDSRQSMVRLTPKPLPQADAPSWEDTGWQGQGLPSGKTLVYAVSAIDTSFNQGAPAFVEVKIPDTAPPGAAFSLSARSTADGRASLSWQPSLSRSLAIHRVQRKSDGDFATVVEIPVGTATWIDATVQRGKTYSYRVIEVNGAGVESAPSPIATLTVTSSVPPAPPTSLSAVPAEKGITLTWGASPSADTRGYIVYRAPYKGAQFVRITPTPVAGTSRLDPKGATDNVYAVATVDVSGNEGPRVTAPVTVSSGKARQ